MTMALTQMQWRIAVACVWAMAQAVRRSIRRLMKGKALVSITKDICAAGDELNFLGIRIHTIIKL